LADIVGDAGMTVFAPFESLTTTSVTVLLSFCATSTGGLSGGGDETGGISAIGDVPVVSEGDGSLFTASGWMGVAGAVGAVAPAVWDVVGAGAGSVAADAWGVVASGAAESAVEAVVEAVVGATGFAAGVRPASPEEQAVRCDASKRLHRSIFFPFF